jgi:hypothetical protein
MRRMNVIPPVAALAMQTPHHFPQALGGSLPMAPPPLTARDVERLEAAQAKRRRRAQKRTRTLQGGIHGAKLSRVTVDERVEL